jgi:hypothetical protein
LINSTKKSAKVKNMLPPKQPKNLSKNNSFSIYDLQPTIYYLKYAYY